MPTMIVRHRVANFDSWKTTFDAMQPIRARHSWISAEVLRDAADPNLVTVINRVRDLSSAKRYGASPGLREAMAAARVLTLPEVQFLTEAA